MKILKDWQYPLVFLFLLVVLAGLYSGSFQNYFFSDDYQWLSHAVLVDDSISELFLVRGRDFNPLLSFFFYLMVKIGGLSPIFYRVICLLAFAGALSLFYYILTHYFKVRKEVGLTVTLLLGFNVYISEVMLYLSTFVYAVTMILFLVAVKYWLDGKKILYAIFILLAFQVKETAILATIPLFLYEKKWNNRFFIAGTSIVVFFTRFFFQAGSTGSYTHFANFENLGYKIYFLLMYPINLSPMGFYLWQGVIILLVLALAFAYFLRTNREALFFGGLFFLYVAFFAFLPRLSSKYYFYPAFAFWGLAGLLGHHLYEKHKALRFVLPVLLLISLLFNYPAIQREVEDYRILGDYSREFVQSQGEIVKSKLDYTLPSQELKLPRVSKIELARVYEKIYQRDNLLKLLPLRQKSLGGLITPLNLVPFVHFPEKLVRWQDIETTPGYFRGKCTISSLNE